MSCVWVSFRQNGECISCFNCVGQIVWWCDSVKNSSPLLSYGITANSAVLLLLPLPIIRGYWLMPGWEWRKVFYSGRWAKLAQPKWPVRTQQTELWWGSRAGSAARTQPILFTWIEGISCDCDHYLEKINYNITSGLILVTFCCQIWSWII